MLKNRKAAYILIPLNLLIWGYFIFRFAAVFEKSQANETTTATNTFIKIEKPDTVIQKLRFGYHDPFLKGRHPQKSAQNETQLVKKPMKVTPPKPDPPEPVKKYQDLKYLGLVKNQKSGAATALIHINGQSKLVRVNESVEDLIFKSFNNDSLVAKAGSERIVLRK